MKKYWIFEVSSPDVFASYNIYVCDPICRRNKRELANNASFGSVCVRANVGLDSHKFQNHCDMWGGTFTMITKNSVSGTGMTPEISKKCLLASSGCDKSQICSLTYRSHF